LFSDLNFEIRYAKGSLLGDNSDPVLCRLEDGILYNEGLRMTMLKGYPLMRRLIDIIDRVVETGLYNLWGSRIISSEKICFRKIAIENPHGGYYSFNLYHVQPAFYLLLMGRCLSALSFMAELLYNRVLIKRK